MPEQGRTTSVGLDQFFSAIFPKAAQGYIEVEAWQSKTRIFIPVNDRDAITQFVLLHEKEDVFFGAATRETPGDHATVQNCRDLWVLFVDVWFRETPEREARSRLKTFPLRPSVIVAAGDHLQLYWQLRTVIPEARMDEDLYRLLRRFARRLGGDWCASMPHSMMRMPGSANSRVPAAGVNAWCVPPPRVVIEVLRPERAYDLEEFFPHISTPPGKRT